VHETLEKVGLQQVLNDLRIVIDPDWREIDGNCKLAAASQDTDGSGRAAWPVQAFLNLAQNSLRAVQGCTVRELSITVCVEQQRVAIRFQDTGPG